MPLLKPNLNQIPRYLLTREILLAEVERLQRQDKVHWRTPKTLLNDIERLYVTLKRIADTPSDECARDPFLLFPMKPRCF